MHARVPDALPESTLKLCEGGEDTVGEPELYLNLLLKRLVAVHCMFVPGRSHHRLEVGVIHEWGWC